MDTTHPAPDAPLDDRAKTTGHYGSAPLAERPEDHLAALRPVSVPNAAVRAALLLLEEIETQPGQSGRMRTNARDVHDILALTLNPSAPMPPAVSLPSPAAGEGDWVQFNTYLPKDLRRRLKAACAADGVELRRAATEALEAWLGARERAQ